MIAHPIAYIVFIFIGFYFIGISRIIDVVSELKKDKELFAMETKPLKKFTLITKIYHIALFLVTVITLIVCYFSTEDIMSIVCRKYVLIALAILTIKKLADFTSIHRKKIE